MNKQELIGLPNTDRDISALSDKLNGKRILIIEGQTDRRHPLRDFFDVIVASGHLAKPDFPNPDIFIHTKPFIDFDGVVELSRSLDLLASTLICVNLPALEQMSRRRLRPNNFMLFYDNAEQSIQEIIKSVGASDIWICDGVWIRDSSGASQSIQSFCSKLGVYKTPINLRIKDRKLMMESW